MFDIKFPKDGFFIWNNFCQTIPIKFLFSGDFECCNAEVNVYKQKNSGKRYSYDVLPLHCFY